MKYKSKKHYAIQDKIKEMYIDFCLLHLSDYLKIHDFNRIVYYLR